MSTGQENFVWKRPNGTWARGFLSPDCWSFDKYGDEEVEWDYNRFANYREGFPTANAAANWQPGANPGHVTYIDRNSDHEREFAEQLDRNALRFVDPAAAAKADRADFLREVRKGIKEKNLRVGQRVKIVVGSASIGTGWSYTGHLTLNDKGETVLNSGDKTFVILTKGGNPTFKSEVNSVRVVDEQRRGYGFY